MDTIPAEILQQFFINVCFTDRLECLRVCRNWYSVLDRQSLLYDLDISNSQYGQLKETLKHLHHRRLQVEYLTIRICSPYSFDKRTLFNMFPNLREIALLPMVYSRQKQKYMDSPFQFDNNSSKLEKIKDYGECELTRQLIISNACQQLKSLQLEFGTYGYSGDIGVSQLKNMPVLEHLHLCSTQIKLMDLESIHDNLPSLESLDLQGELVPYVLPRDIEPALLVTKLKLDMEYNEEFDTHIQLYNYMSKKYPSLSTLILDDEAIDEEGGENLQTLFERGLFPFFQSIQPQTLSFTLSNYYDEINLFKKFDAFAWKLQELKLTPPYDDHHLFGEIAQSEQSKYIQKLTLMDSVCFPINLLSNMQVLTCLHLEYHHAYKSTDNNVNLSELIEYSPPTLTHLTLSNINLLFNGSTLKHSSITHLNIRYIMSPLLTELLETHFPKLSVFNYHGGVNGKYTVALPTHDLEEFEVIILYPKNQTTELSIESTYGDTVQYRALKQGGDTPGRLVGVTKEEFDNMSTSNKLTFVCASVKKMIFCIYPY